MQKLAKILRMLSVVGKWYTRRSTAAKAMIIFVFFVLPLLLYAYMEATKELSKAINTNITSWFTEPPQALVKYRSQNCNLFGGKTLFIFGYLTVSDTCYLIDNSTYVYDLGGSYTLVKVYGNISGDIAYVVALQKRLNITVDGELIEVQKVAVVIFADRVDSHLLRTILDENGLHDTFCAVATPGNSWSSGSVPVDTFVEVCSSY